MRVWQVIEMPSPEMKKNMLLITNSLENVGMEGTRDMASHGLCKNGGREINFALYLGTTYDLSSMEVIGNS